MTRAGNCLALLRELIRGKLPAPIIRRLVEEPARFGAFLMVALKWAHFHTNPSDKAARLSEKAVLAEWLAAVGDDTFISLTDLINRRDDPFDQPQRRALKDDLLDESKERLAILALSKLAVLDGFREFFDHARNAAMRPLLFDPVGPIWTGGGAARTAEVLATAPDDRTVQENARLWLVLACCAQKGEFEVDGATVSAFMGATDPVPTLWAAAVAGQLQFRMLFDTRKLRDELISFGAEETALPVPDWLQDQA